MERVGVRPNEISQPMRAFLLACLFLSACPKAPQSALQVEFASPEELPVAAKLSEGCNQEEAEQLSVFIGLLPPWDKERPPAMLELGLALEKSDEVVCLKAAKRVFFELAMVYPNQRESLRATLEVGAISQHLKEPADQLEAILSRYENREARLVEIAKSDPGERGIAFLRAYGGESADALIVNYTSWLRRGAPPE
jgi:hypothetical protein